MVLHFGTGDTVRGRYAHGCCADKADEHGADND